jgi:hypothetical protein
MHKPSKEAGVAVLSVTFLMALFTPVFSLEGESYDTPAVQQPGKTIQGKIVKVVKSDAVTHTWDVSVENEETGEVVPLHLDKATARKVTDIDPAVGENVVVMYDEHSKHAISFAAVAATKN